MLLVVNKEESRKTICWQPAALLCSSKVEQPVVYIYISRQTGSIQQFAGHVLNFLSSNAHQVFSFIHW